MEILVVVTIIGCALGALAAHITRPKCAGGTQEVRHAAHIKPMYDLTQCGGIRIFRKDCR